MTEGQRLALAQVEDVVGASGGKLELLRVFPPDESRSSLWLEFRVSCRDYPRATGGLPLRDRERFHIVVPKQFPFTAPGVNSAHRRFAGHPHVQWGSHLCLYLSQDTEWDPADGMFGFLQRLDEWLRQGALGQLDPVGAPLHPPVAYSSTKAHLVIPRADTPGVPEGGWRGLALLRPVSDGRTDVIGWKRLGEFADGDVVGAAIMLDKPLTFFEFPKRVVGLLLALIEHGIPLGDILWTVQIAAFRRAVDAPLLVLVGSPMRGIAGGDRKQHLVAWQIEAEATRDLRLSLAEYLEQEEFKALGKEAEDRFFEWAKDAEVTWCPVREARPEVTRRRDLDTPVSWFSGKAVAVWGCGAIGSHVAEYVVRAGARKVVLVDDGNVTPGVLVRQRFDDTDIGENKAVALAARLRSIFPASCVVDAFEADVAETWLEQASWHEGFDVILDCTASRAVLKKLEYRCGQLDTVPVPIASLVVGPRADHGLVALAHRGSVGGPGSVLRDVKLTLMREGPKELLDEFWPGSESRSTTLFQPEPGCSDVTFVGAATDVASLAAGMLEVLAQQFLKGNHEGGVCCAVSRPGRADFDGKSALEFGVPNALGVRDRTGRYQVAIRPAAWAAIREEIFFRAKKRGRKVETGGILYGERDDAARVIWIDGASEPPLDSSASPDGFECGVLGVLERVAELAKQTGGTTRFVGMWHTHPDMAPLPSAEDYRGMNRLLGQFNRASDRCLMLIVGGNLERSPEVRAYTFAPGDLRGGSTQGHLRARFLYPIRMGMYTVYRGTRVRATSFTRSLRSVFDRIVRNRGLLVASVRKERS